MTFPPKKIQYIHREIRKLSQKKKSSFKGLNKGFSVIKEIEILYRVEFLILCENWLNKEK